MFGYNCRYTVCHAQNNNHLNQTIGIIWHKRGILVKDDTTEWIFLKKKRNYHETIYDGAIGMTSRLVGFLKQAKNRMSDWSLRQRHGALISSPLSPSQKQCETYPSSEKNAAVFANRIRWKTITITSLTEVTAVSTINLRHERKKSLLLTLWKSLYAGRKYFDKLKPEPGLLREVQPDV